MQDIFALSPAYNTRPAAEETINDPTNPEHYWWAQRAGRRLRFRLGSPSLLGGCLQEAGISSEAGCQAMAHCGPDVLG